MAMPWGRRCGPRALLAAALSISSTPLFAEQLILRCDSPNNALSFSVLIDPAKRLVLEIGFGSKIETEHFSDTVIAASDKSSNLVQSLVIDRVTGQFQLSWAPAKGSERGGNYQGSCSPGRRQF